MKMFKCSNGGLVNPANVTHCYTCLSEGVYTLKFEFVGGTSFSIYHKRINQADNELLDYEQHCESMVCSSYQILGGIDE